MSVLKDLGELDEGISFGLFGLTLILGLVTIVGATIVLCWWAEACRPMPVIDPEARPAIERRLDEIERRLDAAARELRPR